MKLDKVRFVLVLLLAAAVVWSATLSSVLTMALAALAVLPDVKGKIASLRQNKVLLGLLLFFLLHLTGVLYSTNTHAAWFDVEKKLSFAAFPLIFAGATFLTEARRRHLLLVFSASTGMAALVCVAYAFYRNYTIGDPATLPYSFYQNFEVGRPIFGLYWDYFSYSELARPVGMHPTNFSLFVAFSVVVLLYYVLVIRCYRKPVRVLLWVGALFLTLFLLLLSSRIVIGGFCLSLAAAATVLLRQGSISKKALFISAAAALAFVLALLSLPVTRYRLLGELSSVSASAATGATGVNMRLVHWRAACSVAASSPVVGVGNGDTESRLDSYYLSHGHPELLGYNAHNQYLQTFAALGMIGLIVLLVCFLYPLLQAYKQRDILALVFVVLVAVACLTEALLQTNKGIVFFSFFLALFFHHPQPRSRALAS